MRIILYEVYDTSVNTSYASSQIKARNVLNLLSFLVALILLMFLHRETYAADYTVNTVTDSSTVGCPTECTLRESINAANGNPGVDTIYFAIPGAGPHTISLTQPLPVIDDPIVIDGYTHQSGASPNTLPDGIDAQLQIVLDGNDIVVYGLQIEASRSFVTGLVIIRFAQAGIVLANCSENNIEGNFIGVDATGVLEQGNFQGIEVFNSFDNHIGGLVPAARNLVSGNDRAGISLINAGSTGNVVQGNFIGIDRNGNALPNRTGVAITQFIGSTDLADMASNNTIGGVDDGARNIISGNTLSGVEVLGNQNQVFGNYIGTDPTGLFARGNGDNGVSIFEGSDNRIGDTQAGAGNLISGNTNAGVEISGIDVNAFDNKVRGNLIGTDVDGDGSTELGNEDDVRIQSFQSGSGAVFHNVIGGTDAAARNIISGNLRDGIRVSGSGTFSNSIQGNYIGLNATGDGGRGNGQHGILLTFNANGPSHGTTIGGADPGAGNAISDNGQDGIQIGNAVSNTIVLGNRIGTNAAGSDIWGNKRNGITIASDNNRIGDIGDDDGNLISGNAGSGIYLLGPQAHDNLILGNRIGTNSTGTAALPNLQSGIFLFEASDNRIGDVVPGAGNLISGNGESGIDIYAGSEDARDNRIYGNTIGTDVSGENAIGNLDGITLFTDEGSIGSVFGNIIGGGDLADGAVDGFVDARNQISGNRRDGVVLLGPQTTLNWVQGNYIGTNGLGTDALGNSRLGMLISSNGELSNGASANIVGGTDAGSGNVISGNANDGVQITDGAGQNEVVGNYIGTNNSGTDPIANGGHGIAIYGASDNEIGSLEEDARNVISGNALNGVRLGSSGSDPAIGNLVLGNNIGVDVSGQQALANQLSGIYIDNVPGNTIGITTTGAINVISGNQGHGIQVFGADAQQNHILGNHIGVDSSGIQAIPNAFDGILIESAPQNQIGEVDAAQRNVIAANGDNGIQILGAAALSNTVENNYIGAAIDMSPLGNLRHGIFITAANGTIVGGSAQGASNVIAYNGNSLNRRGHGVVVASGTGNTIRHNQIFKNAGRGIDLNNSF